MQIPKPQSHGLNLKLVNSNEIDAEEIEGYQSGGQNEKLKELILEL